MDNRDQSRKPGERLLIARARHSKLKAPALNCAVTMSIKVKQILRSWPCDVPFERAVRQNLALLLKLNDAGQAWGTIADLLTSVGARHKHDRPVSGKMLNTVVLRSKRALSKAKISVTVDNRLGEERPVLSDPVPPSQANRPQLDPPTQSQNASNALGQRLADAAFMRNSARGPFEE